MKRASVLVIAAVFTVLIGLNAFNTLPGVRAEGGGAERQTTAAGQTVTFAVEKMTCAACPITVRKAMENVDGVKSVTVDFNAKTATVIFDPAVTTPEQIGQASSTAGHPATPSS